jgi:hypothetical protein
MFLICLFSNFSLDKLILFYTFIGFILALCPPSEILNPCKCNAYGISCGGNEWYNLKHIFKAIDQRLKNNEKHFNQFELNNTAITELEENTFYEITFDEIYIYNATKLKLINTHAFTATNLVTKKFFVNRDIYFTTGPSALTNSPPNYDIFLMLSSIISLEEIKICNTNINQIPSRAFRSINGIQKNLSTIEFYGSPIVKVGDYPFYSLNNLIHLEFSATSIKSIPKTVFHFRNDSNVTMTLNLYSNDLNGTSFAMGSLTNLKETDNYKFLE